MQYPMLKNYLEYEEDEEGNVIVADYIQGYAYTISPDTISFGRKLNGSRSPHTIPGYTAQERRVMLRELRETKLLRESRVLEKHFGSIYFTLLYDHLNERFGFISKIWNNLLIITFLPMLAIGCFCYLTAKTTFDGSVLGGFIVGLVLGAIAHEFSHGAACICYGGTVHETGIMISKFLPGAYVLMDTDNIKGKLRRVQVDAAGIEMNLLLGGFFLLLASFLPFSAFFLTAAIENIFLGLLNLCFVSGLDGSSIIGEFLGSESFVSKTKDILFNRKIRRKLLQKPSGIAILFAAIIFLICQIALPLLLIDNLLAIFEVFQ